MKKKFYIVRWFRYELCVNIVSCTHRLYIESMQSFICKRLCRIFSNQSILLYLKTFYDLVLIDIEVMMLTSLRFHNCIFKPWAVSSSCASFQKGGYAELVLCLCVEKAQAIKIVAEFCCKRLQMLSSSNAFEQSRSPVRCLFQSSTKLLTLWMRSSVWRRANAFFNSADIVFRVELFHVIYNVCILWNGDISFHFAATKQKF